MSSCLKDYVMDERGTFGDLDHPNAQLFAYRFSFSFKSVKELIAKVQETGEHFWKKKHDAARRESSPIELLVLGSLRILRRNVTLDDLYEQTFISAEVHRCFFQKFMKWYSTPVFPEVVQMPLLGDLDYNDAEYSLAVFPGCVCSVDCVHVKVSAKLKQNSTFGFKSRLKMLSKAATPTAPAAIVLDLAADNSQALKLFYFTKFGVAGHQILSDRAIPLSPFADVPTKSDLDLDGTNTHIPDKEHFPSRVFEVAVNRRGMTVSVTKGLYGSVVNMTIVKFDSAMVAMREGICSDYEFLLYDATGSSNITRLSHLRQWLP